VTSQLLEMRDPQVFVIKSSGREIENRVCAKKLAVHQNCLLLGVLFVQTTRSSCVNGPEVFDENGYV
jgi:CRISPR/Cas system type I-B associated protein Csh2 (Cas7 group RAMP superfamily)